MRLTVIGLCAAVALTAAPAIAQQQQGGGTLSPVGQQQQQQQGQQQGQAQGQRQGQSQQAVGIGVGIATSASNSSARANSASINAGNRQNNRQSNNQSSSLSNSNKFESRPSAPSIGGGGMGFGGAGSYGNRNGCVMHRQQAWNVGGSVGYDSSGITGGGALIGRGTTEMVLLVNCAIGEAANDFHAVGLTKAAALMQCVDPWKARILNIARPGFCDGVPIVNEAFIREDTFNDLSGMLVSTVQPQPQPSQASRTPRVVAQTSRNLNRDGPKRCEHGVNDWGRCVNPDFDNL